MNDGMNACAPAKQSPIDKGIENVLKALATAEESFGSLEVQLTPVMCERRPQIDGPDKELEESIGESNLFSMLGEIKGRLATLNRHIQETTGRLEV